MFQEKPFFELHLMSDLLRHVGCFFVLWPPSVLQVAEPNNASFSENEVTFEENEEFPNMLSLTESAEWLKENKMNKYVD